jgi:hypothetical protein
MQGDEEGIKIYNKLGSSDDPQVRNYFRYLGSALERWQSAYFSDFVEQKKKPLNNQKIYYMHWSAEKSSWLVQLFHTPS